MSLKNFVRSLLIVGIGAMAQSAVAADAALPAANLSATLASPRASENAKLAPQLADPAQDELISEVLGVSDRVQPPGRKLVESEQMVFTCAATVKTVKQVKQNESGATRRQPTYTALLGRIIAVHLDTSTVDVEFEGRRTTTVGSKFSVFHDYALSTEYLGNLEVVYLAGGNRAIAKPGRRTDITKMGKGDRVSGRIVADKNAADGTEASGDDFSTKPSHVHPPQGNMPVPPPDPATAYVPKPVGVAKAAPKAMPLAGAKVSPPGTLLFEE